MNDSTPAAVLFDLYHTLIRVSEEERVRHSQEIAAALRLNDDEFAALWFATASASRRGEIATTHERFAQVLAAADAPRPVVNARAPEHASPEELRPERGEWPSPAHLTQLEHEFLACAAQPAEGILEVLATLRDAGIRTWLISNCSRSVEHALAATGVRDHLDGATLSCDVGVTKPDPAIFAAAVSGLGVDAAHAAYVGDGEDDELEAASAAGMKVFRAAWSVDRPAAGRDAPVLRHPRELLAELGLAAQKTAPGRQ